LLEIVPYPLYFLAIPTGLRLTCYYFHGWLEERILRPSAKILFNTANFVPDAVHGILGNFSVDMLHRYFLMLSIPLVVVHLSITIYHMLVSPSSWLQVDSLQNIVSIVQALFQPSSWAPHFGFFNLTELIDSLALTAYVASCHATRYFCGSGERCISCVKKEILLKQSGLNEFHGYIFWISIATVMLQTAVVVAANMGVLRV
jgi:hypothetical protein